MKNIFVLGGSGFLGKHIVEELIKEDVDIHCLLNKTPLSIDSSKIKTTYSPLSQFNWKSLEADLPDVIVHSARTSGKNKQERTEFSQYNAIANQRLIDWLSGLSKPPLLIFVSGTLVYGSHGTKIMDETAAPVPCSFQKQYFEAEKPIYEALKNNKVPIIITRPAWIYGKDSWLQAFYLSPAEKQARIPLYGKGKNLMNLIHVQDCAAKIVKLISAGKSGEIYNLYTHKAIEQKEFVDLLSGILNKPIQRIPSLWIKIRYEKAVQEAFSFSLNLNTIHQDTFIGLDPYYPDLKEGLETVIRN
ncbi:MAG: NAD(P)-dependent oxidoreductase [Bacteroidetes bacterium]|nr:NAD(P)-dependent oxidoreductase [Bacteroidota bacterium]